MRKLSNAVSFTYEPRGWGMMKSGLKLNMIRVVTQEDYEWLERERPAEVYVVDTENQRVFVRTITHIQKVDETSEGVWIMVSWKDTCSRNTCAQEWV